MFSWFKNNSSRVKLTISHCNKKEESGSKCICHQAQPGTSGGKFIPGAWYMNLKCMYL